jgi:hypothetical protein
MTILSTEPRVSGFRRASDVVPQSSPVKSLSTYTNGLSASISTHVMPRPGPSNLLARFIEQFNELEAYKYIPSYPLRFSASNHVNSQAWQVYRHRWP